MVGPAIRRKILSKGYTSLINASRKVLDIRNQQWVPDLLLNKNQK